jgi:fluoride ion exporter CrcB/FEX
VKKLLVIAAGGVAGSLLRYLLGESISTYSITIFIANLLGVGVAGVIALRVKPSELNRLFWIPGFAGSLTTFSSVALIHAQRSDLSAIAYFYTMVALSLLLLLAIKPRSEQVS